MKPRLLVVHTGGAGDFICLMPALSRLRARARVEIAGIPERAALAHAAGLADAVHDLDHIGFSSVFTSPNARLCEFASRFDQAMVFMEDGDGFIRNNLIAAGIPDVACFPGIPPKDWNKHAAHWYAQCTRVDVNLPYKADFGTADARADIVIQPGSGGRSKNWPLEYFECVAGMLEAAGHTVLWCYGPAEEGLRREGKALPPMALVELAPVLAGARLFIGNDSGTSHLAGAAGCPTLAIFGTTNPAVWAPAGPRVRVLRGERWPGVDEVYRMASTLLGDTTPA